MNKQHPLITAIDNFRADNARRSVLSKQLTRALKLADKVASKLGLRIEAHLYPKDK